MEFIDALKKVVFGNIIVRTLAIISEGSKTEIMTKEGYNALKDPIKKKEIDLAFQKAISNCKETGVWINPTIEL